MLIEKLEQFTGTEHYYRHWLGFKYTDGIKYLADEAKCHWLLDAIGSYQPKHKNIPFQLWILKVDKKKGILTMQEDSGKKFLVTQKIKYTDFPLDKIELYLIEGVLLLTSEY